MFRPLIYIFLFVMILTHAAFAEPILTASTETVSGGEKSPPPALVNALLSSVDENDSALFLECLNKLNIKKSRRHILFKVVMLPRLTQSEVVYFARPALKPYCFTFYGMHVFRYWLVVENRVASKKSYRILYAGTGDSFEVLPSKHIGYFDIIETNCTAFRCLSVRMHYNGRVYMPFSCSEMNSDEDGREVVNEVPCSH